jgi:TRAP-type C4-dicarboxylate transport system permease small subunit
MKTMNIAIFALRVGAGISLVGMVFLTCADVVGGLFNHPVLGSEEIVGLMGAVVLAFGLPITHREKGHIGVDLVYRLFPDKMKRIVDIGISFVTCVFFALVTWQSYLYAAEMRKVGLVSPTIQFPVHYVIYGVCVGSLILAIMIFVELIEGLRGEINE